MTRQHLRERDAAFRRTAPAGEEKPHHRRSSRSRFAARFAECHRAARGLEGDQRPERRHHARKPEFDQIGDHAVDRLVGVGRFLHQQIAVLADHQPAERIAGQPLQLRFLRADASVHRGAVVLAPGAVSERRQRLRRRRRRAVPPDRTACRASLGPARGPGRPAPRPCDAECRPRGVPRDCGRRSARRRMSARSAAPRAPRSCGG